MPTLRAKLGRAIRRLRKRAGYSQEGLADACKLHRTYIGSVERGNINIALANLERVAQTLGIPLSQLLLEAERDSIDVAEDDWATLNVDNGVADASDTAKSAARKSDLP